MKVQFEFSTADLAEVANRTVNRSPLVHRWRPFATRPTEREHFFAWLLFFACASVAGNLAGAAIGSGAAAIFRMPGATPAYGVYVFALLPFVATACLSYVFFRFFAKRLVSQVQARTTVSAALLPG